MTVVHARSLLLVVIYLHIYSTTARNCPAALDMLAVALVRTRLSVTTGRLFCLALCSCKTVLMQGSKDSCPRLKAACTCSAARRPRAPRLNLTASALHRTRGAILLVAAGNARGGSRHGRVAAIGASG